MKLKWITKDRRKNYSTKKNILLFTAWSIIIIGVIIVLSRNPNITQEFDWIPAAIIAAILTPMTMACNAAGLCLSASVIGRTQKFNPSLKIVTIGSLANQLPIPAAFMMRVAALRATGASMSESAHATITISLIWLSFSFLISSIAALHLGLTLVCAALLSIGLLFLAYGIWQFRKASYHLILLIIAFAIFINSLDALRIYMSFKAFGINPHITECFLLTVASALSNIVTIIPGGIGIREYGATALSILTDISPSHTLLAVTVNRFAGLVGAGTLLLALYIQQPSKNRSQNES